ncbi:MAG TPA: hypothetical protein VI072_08415 [Polyangiaceae bacterium]
MLGLLAGVAACSAADDPALYDSAEASAAPIAPITPSSGSRNFVHFESGPVRPVAMSADGTKLFVTNIPDGRLEIFGIDSVGNLSPQASVRVGLEPVAVAVRSASEVWVVNHLSDSVSIVNVASNPPRVTRTLLVGDEPRDIVFAGASNSRAFITTAHRGQNRALVPANLFTTGTQDPQLFTRSVPRADVWVYDSANVGTGAGGTPLKVIELFGDTPRPLTVSPDKNTVYAGVHFSGNQTSVVSATAVCDGWQPNTPCTINGVTYPGGDFGPRTNTAGVQAPDVGLIVKWNAANSRWEDLIGRNWNTAVMFNLPDKDVFAINVGTLSETKNFRGVGTTLMNMVTHPVNGKIYVSNLESNNFSRFEGASAHGTVQGNLAKARITVIDPVTSAVSPRHLNKHINYSVLKAPTSVRSASLSMPVDMVMSGNGSKLYVAAFGSNKIGVYDTAAIDANSFDPNAVQGAHINTRGGPAGIALNESKARLYVLNRFDNSVSAINTSTRAEAQNIKLFNPEPANIVAGRKFLYDATITSSNGEASCASCHIFGDTDNMSWDLGNPGGAVVRSDMPFHLEAATSSIASIDIEIADAVEAMAEIINGTGQLRNLHPMKGPMATQTLRGMQNHGPMHWRGDRVVGHFGTDSRQDEGPPFGDPRLNFRNFIVAFDGLVGRSGLVSDAEMNAFADFAMNLLPPPNPIRNLDNSLTSAQERGRKYFFGCDGPDTLVPLLPNICQESYDGNGGVLDPMGKGHGAAGSILLGLYETCESCHRMDPEDGFFGADGQMAFDQITQSMKVPHFRNAYAKVGMFGQHKSPLQNQTPDLGVHQGDQIRGFGFQSSGAMDQLFHFFNGEQFNGRAGNIIGFANDNQRRDVISFVMASPADLAPVVGQQMTLTNSNAAAAGPRIDMLIARAKAQHWAKELGGGINECELTANATIAGKQRGWLFRASNNNFEPDDGTARVSDATLRALAATAGQEVTYTCVPPGSGSRMAIDRDNDRYPNQVDPCPNDASNTCTPTPVCQMYGANNESHYSAGRATRERDCFILCGAYRYKAKGTNESLGSGSTTTTLYSTNGTSWTKTSCGT